MAMQMSKKKFVAVGVFFAEDGYSGVEVRVTPMRTEIIIRASRTQNVLDGEGPMYNNFMKIFCRVYYGVLRFIMEGGAKGCEVIVCGKLRTQRAKSMKFNDGYMISSGQPVKEYIDFAVRHVLLRQAVLGIKVKIMLDWDRQGKQGPTTPLQDIVTIHAPKDDEEFIRPPTGPQEI